MSQPARFGPRAASLFLLPWIAVAGPLVAQEAKAVLHAPLVVLPVDSAPFQKLADVDGDGDLDAIGTRAHENGSSSEIAVWRNDDGAFSQVFLTSSAIGAGNGTDMRSLPVATADFDGNGLQDFVVAGGYAAVRYTSQPGFQFTTQSYQLSTTWTGSRAVATGDFDGDGQIDFAVAADDDGSSNGTLDVFLANGTTLTTPIPVSWAADVRLLALDLDGTGGVDLLYGDRKSATVSVYVVTAGQLQSPQSMTSSLNYGGSTPWLWMGGDLDGDSDVDLVCFKPELGTNGIPHYQIFRRSGASAFVAESVAVGGPAEYLADIDGDGDLDGVCCGGGGPIYEWPELDFASTFELSTNRGGDGDFARAWSFPGAGSESMAGVADLDADGDVELVAGRCVFYGAGPWDAPPMPEAGGKNATIVMRPWHLHDLDRDGDPDFGPYLINNGVGEFTRIQPPLTGLLGCDVDGDGARDRVSRLYVPGPTGSQFVGMVWLQNNGGGHLRDAGEVGPPGMMIGGQYSYTVADYTVADFDGDGDEDIFFNGGSQLYWNDGGYFPGPPELVVGRVDLVADFDADGLPDLVTSDFAGMHVRRGTGQPGASFPIAWPFQAMPFEPGATVLGDVNDDGLLDFVRPDPNGEPVLFVNTSTPASGPTFAVHTLEGEAIKMTPPNTPAAVRPTIAVADFDGDGMTDIALGRVPGEPNVGVVLRRTSWSNPPTLGDYEVIRLAFVDGYAIDVDLDGDQDLVGERSVFGRVFHGAGAGYRRQRNDGVAGGVGAVPVLGATGPFRCGETEVLRLTGVPGPTIAVFGMSLGETVLPNVPLPGLTLRLDPATLIVGEIAITENGDGRAAAMATTSIYLVNGLQGFRFYMQAFVFDLAAPQWFSQSNLMVKQIGW